MLLCNRTMADILSSSKPATTGGVLRPTYTLPSDVVAAAAAAAAAASGTAGAALQAPPAKLQRRAHSRGSTGSVADGAQPKVASFVAKLYEIVNNAQLAALVGWNPDAKTGGFVVWDVERFSLQVLPRYYKHSNFHSFVRQLNNYGFHKIDAKRGDAYEHRFFVRGRADLLVCITRKLPLSSSSAASSSELSGSEDDSASALDALFAEARDELGPAPLGPARRPVRRHLQPPSPGPALLPSPRPSAAAAAALLGMRATVSDSERAPADAAAAFRQPLGTPSLALLRPTLASPAATAAAAPAPGAAVPPMVVGAGGAQPTPAEILAAVMRVECETDRLHSEVARLRAELEAARQREQGLSATMLEILNVLQQLLQRVPTATVPAPAAPPAAAVPAVVPPKPTEESQQQEQQQQVLPPLLNKNEFMAVTNFCTS